MITVQQPDGRWILGTFADVLAAEDEACRKAGAPTSNQRRAVAQAAADDATKGDPK